MVAVCASPPMGPARTRWSARSGSPAPPSGSPGPDPHPATVCAVTCSIVFPEPSILRAAWLGWAEPSVHFGAQGEVMTSIDEFSGWGQLARVRYVENRRRVYIQLSNGSTGWVDSRRPVDFDVGDTVLLTEDNIELAPHDCWQEEPWVAVVRIKNSDTTVVEFAGQARIIPTNDVRYSRGNTVEVRSSGVVRVLDENPLRFLDLPEVDETVVQQFIVKASDTRETFDDFGGLSEVVTQARELIEVPLKYRDALQKIGARQVKGVLFTGDPGTGKTMLARIIAQESKATFFHISGPEVISKWYGQSEELLRMIFARAKNESSAIIFFDEIDSLAAQRSEEAHEASRRLVAQFLTLMDGFNRASNVVVIATTNRPQDIDIALRRPGRFDWTIHFPRPNISDREQILATSARRLQTLDYLPHSEIAAQTEGWTAADLAAIWTEAALLAATDGRDVIMAEDYVGGFKRVEALRRKAMESPEKTQ